MRKYIEFSKVEGKDILGRRTMDIIGTMVTTSKYREEARKVLFGLRCCIFEGEFKIVDIDIKNSTSVSMVKNILKQSDTIFILEIFVLSREDLVLTSKHDKTIHMIQHDIETSLSGVATQLYKSVK